MSKDHWTEGNQLQLLVNGEEFFPAVFEAIAGAKAEVLVETFILFEDNIGKQLHQALIDAGRRGVKVDLTIDGYACFQMTPAFIQAMTDAGVKLHVIDPKPTLLGFRTNMFRRLHRKLVVVDETIGFIGGINYSADHCLDFGPEAKQDYAVRVVGPVVTDMRRLIQKSLGRPLPPRKSHTRGWRFWKTLGIPARGPGGGAGAMLVARDNDRHRNDIEWNYRVAMRSARDEIVIANAYFLPGYRFLRDMRNAARRGVKIHLILQGRPDKAIAQWAATTLYDKLLSAGVRIHEFCERPLHGKVATMDGEWATVGSSNLDPTSLSFNLEANLVIRDRAFTTHLRGELQTLIDHQCREIRHETLGGFTIYRHALSFIVFHLLRWFPSWIGSMPAHRPTLMPGPEFAAIVVAPPAAVDDNPAVDHREAA